MKPKNNFKRCQWMLEDGSQCPNYFQGQGKYCHGHPEPPKPPDRGPGKGLAWVAAIANLINLALAAVTTAWPHVQPWITHIHFFTQLGQLLDDVIATGENGPDEASHLDFTARYETLSADYNARFGPPVVIELGWPPHREEYQLLATDIEGLEGTHIIGRYNARTRRLTHYAIPKKVWVKTEAE
jgi:hypothetical protein